MIKIDDTIKSKLLPYQVNHTENLIYSLKTYQRVLDASDTGTGKTYTAIAACLHLKLKPLIICPKSVLTIWLNVLKHMGAPFYGVSNYESIQNCKYFSKDIDNKISCPFIKRTKIIKEIKIKMKPDKKEKFNEKKEIEFLYSWQIPEDMVLIFDEAHRCKNVRTMNSHILKQSGINKDSKIMMISATVSDKPENFAVVGYILGLYKTLKEASPFIETVGKDFDNPMQGVHNELFPELCSRMRIKDLGELFPNNQIISQTYNMESQEEIQQQYKLIEDAVNSLKNKEDSSGCALSRILYARMRIEQLKIPTFIELAKQYYDEDASVVIFVNFTQTLKTLAQELKTNCLIFGEQTLEERNKNIEDFNSDKSRLIICNIKSGGCGVSLHDLNGDFPRITIISPTWSAQDLLQALGRVHRANCKTPVRQRIIFCKNADVEEQMCDNIKDKLKNLSLLNEGDLLSYNICGMTDETQHDLDQNEGLSDMEIIIKKITTLNIKKERLKQDLFDTEDELNTMEIFLASM